MKPIRFKHSLYLGKGCHFTSVKSVTRQSFRRAVDRQDREDIEDHLMGLAPGTKYYTCKYEGRKSYFFEQGRKFYIFSREE